MDGKGDVVDQGNEAAEIFRREALTNKRPEGPKATGYCLNCEAHMAPKQRWCDAHCREDWEKAERAAAMAPREPDPAA